MSSLFNRLHPKPEYVVAVQICLTSGEELGLREITRKTGLSRTQSLSTLESLIANGEVESKRQSQTPSVMYRLASGAGWCKDEGY